MTATATARPTDLHARILAGTLDSWIGQEYDLAADEASIAADIATSAVRDAWTQICRDQGFTDWLADVSPALLLLLADGAARSVRSPIEGRTHLRVARLTLGLLATDPRLDRN
ncbi:hypothetical protein ACIQ9P_03685 [Kitasatospora sp. NPDC094019]|uniref:hypothetical protein n=1 Tax=Kitasatospora sp. NPDC094019 TaxID=3364091 RepID=UPI0038037265